LVLKIPQTVVSYVEGHTTKGAAAPKPMSGVLFEIKNEHETLFPNPGVE